MGLVNGDGSLKSTKIYMPDHADFENVCYGWNPNSIVIMHVFMMW